MSILNRPSDGLPSVLIALRRGLIAYGSQTAERLIDLCAPETAAIKSREMARKTLTRWTQLGFFNDDDGVIKLAQPIKKIAADDLNGLRAALLQLTLTTENNPALNTQREEDEDDRSGNSRAADFTAAASWALAQDPYTFPHSFPAVERMLSTQRLSLKLYSNDVRWQGFLEWVVFLGVGIQSARAGVVLNPFFAVASVLDKIFQGTSELPQHLFLDRLAEFFPIVDGGAYRKIIDAVTAQPWYTLQPHQVSPCLSAALQTLVEMKVLHLEPRSDAPQCALLGRGGRETGYTFSHVTRLGDA